MKKNIFKISCALVLSAILSSCDWLAEDQPARVLLSDYFHSGTTCIYNVNADYICLAWEFNSTYYPEYFIGDVASDDALKGGENIPAMPHTYDFDNFKWNQDNEFLLQYYRAQYQGIGRCNLSLKYIPDVECDDDMDENLKNRLLGEVHFLRAYYYFRLLRLFGHKESNLGVIMPTEPIESQAQWVMDRASYEDVFNLIVADLTFAEENLWEVDKLPASDLGRATKGAARALLMNVYMWRHNAGDYALAIEWGNKIVESGKYQLVDDYASNFKLAGENNAESIFEIQYANEGTSDYGSGNGSTRGTFTTRVCRARSQNFGGWGFNKPTRNLFDEFDENDPRRDVACFEPIDSAKDSIDLYLGTWFQNGKSGLYNETRDGVDYKLAHDTRGDLNNKRIRYADVLLMLAEAYLEEGNEPQAITYLNQVRERARAYALALDNTLDAATTLPDYVSGGSAYQINKNGLGALVNPTTLEAIRHERRVELAMEGHRWFDLVRWGVAVETMNAYREWESDEVKMQMAQMQPYHNYFPIPAKEIQLNPQTQNPNY